GTLDDGSAGLREIARAGGIAVVQDPDDATYRGMPTAAIASARPLHVLPVERIGPLLVDLARRTVQDEGAMPDPEELPDDETLSHAAVVRGVLLRLEPMEDGAGAEPGHAT